MQKSLTLRRYKVDASEQYQDMCRKANEMWNGRKFEMGDIMVIEDSEDNVIDGIFEVQEGRYIKGNESTNYCDYDFFDAVICWGGRYFWKPTVGQLTKILKEVREIRKSIKAEFECCDLQSPQIDITKIPFETLEQTLLNQVMIEKYGKAWVNDGWKEVYDNFNPLIIRSGHPTAWDAVKKYFSGRTDGKCEVCSEIPSSGKLHIHHKNGNSLDNRIENLIGVCPQCHRKLHKELKIINMEG